MKRFCKFFSPRFSFLAVILCFLFSITLGVSSLAADDASKAREFPYSLGGGIEGNFNTREGIAMAYGVALDRYFLYSGDSGILQLGVKGYMQTDFEGISGTELDFYMRLNMANFGSGKLFGQVSLGHCSYREDEINVSTMHMDFTFGYRAYLLDGFYIEPYVRTGFPFLLGAGIMIGHWFSF